MDESLNEAKAAGAASDSTVRLERTSLTEDEYSSLIREANSGMEPKYLACSFGNGVHLSPKEENRWAFELLAQMRSNE